MKHLLLASLMFVPYLAIAQSATDSTPAPTTPADSTPTPPAATDSTPSSPTSTDFGSSQKEMHHRSDIEKELVWLKNKVGLTDAEQDKVKVVLVSRDEQLKAIGSDTTLTPDQRQGKTKELQDTVSQKIEALLTPDQVELFEKP